MAFRALVLTLLTTALLAAGLLAPVSARPFDDGTPTVSQRMQGLPSLHVARSGRSTVALSRRARADMPFSMIGFEVPAGTDVEFRTSVDGERWSPWQHAHMSADGPDPGSPEARNQRRMSEPVWVGEARHLQTRVASNRAAEARPEAVTAHLVDSLGLSRSGPERVLDRLRAAWRGTPPAAAATPARPTIVTRKQWGANEALRSGSPSYADRVKLGVVHHTAGSNRYTREQSPAVVRGVYHYHTQSNGWSDIGYNFLVDRYGTIYEGRYGGMTKPVIGAHAGGFNTRSFGVSLMGNFTSAGPTRAAKGALVRLLAWKLDIHHIDVFGSQRYTSQGSTRYPAGQVVTVDNLGGHRDVSSTSCPGAYLYAYLPKLRRRVADRQGPVIVSQRVNPRRLRLVDGASVDGAATMRARLRPPGPWRLVVRNPDGVTVRSATGSGEHAKVAWSPRGVARGRYRFVFKATGRRAAAGSLRLVPPAITANGPSTVWTDGNGNLLSPATFTAQLYPGAEWKLRVFDAAGHRVFGRRGTSESFLRSWTGSAAPGAYRWVVRSDDVPPVRGDFRVYADRISRIARGSAPVALSVGLSKRVFGDGEASRVVLAPRGDRLLAMIAQPLAGGAGPVLTTPPDEADDRITAEISRVLSSAGIVYVLGDESVISDAALADVTAPWVRVDGSNAKQIGAAASDLVLAGQSKRRAIVVGRHRWREGAAAPALGAAKRWPILVSGRDTLARPTRKALARNAVHNVVVIASRRSVGDAAMATARDISLHDSAIRVSRSTSAAAAATVARRLWRRKTAGTQDRWLFTSVAEPGSWQRLYSASQHAARTAAVPLLVERSKVPDPTRRYLEALGFEAGHKASGQLVGPSTTVSGALERPLSALLQ